MKWLARDYKKHLFIISVCFFVTKLVGILSFDKIHRYYHHEMIVNHYAIAHAKWHGHHNLMFDNVLRDNMMNISESIGRNVRLEEIESIPKSGEYRQFPLTDLPGYAFLIYYTSKWMNPVFHTGLTSLYAFIIQIFSEFLFLVFIYLVCQRFFGGNSGLWFGLVYTLAYPFTHIFTNQPFRDGFGLTSYGAMFAAIAVFFTEEMQLRRKTIWIGLFLVLLSGVLLWLRPYGIGLLLTFCFAPMVLFFKDPRWKFWERFRFGLISFGILMAVFWIPYGIYKDHYYGKQMGPFISTGLWQGLAEANDSRYEFRYGDRDLLKWAQKKLNDPNLLYNDARLRYVALEYSLEVMKIDPTLFPRACRNRFVRFLKKPLDFDPVYTLPYFTGSGKTFLEFVRDFPEAVIQRLAKWYGMFLFYCAVIVSVVLTVFWYRKGEKKKILFLVFTLAPFFYHLSIGVLHIFAMRHLLGGAWSICFPLAISIDYLTNSFTNSRFAPNLRQLGKI